VGERLDPVAATQALLATVPPAEIARSNAYVEGGYWLLLWGALVALAACFVLLHLGVAARLRDRAERITRRAWLAALLFAAGFGVAISLLELPWAIYAQFVREHQYGLSNQSFTAWLSEWGISLGVSVVLLSPVVAIGYAIARRAERAWWAWVGGLTFLFLAFGLFIQPVLVEPLFNTYTPLPAGPLRDEILSLARANSIPADDVKVVDASRQTSRISANVSGLLGTTRIALNDNLLRACTPDEVLAVMGHELGHYAMGHTESLLIELSAVAALGLFLADRVFRRAQASFGARWGVRGIADPAGLPILYAALVAYGLLTTPLTNTIVRQHEAEADLFALNAARRPDAQATAFLKLARYRKLAPGPLEEALMFDHPSGKSRIEMAMRWKAEQPVPR
jgi:STE24 endopeptidase